MAIARKPAKAAPKSATKTPVVSEAVAAAPAPDAAEVAVPANPVDMQEMIRKSAETGMEQTRAAFERLKTVSEEAKDALGSTCTVTAKGLSEIGMKTLEVVKASTDAHFDFFKSLMAVKSPTEAFALQNTFLREQFAVLKGQTEELTAATQRIAKEAAEPLKATFGKALNLAA